MSFRIFYFCFQVLSDQDVDQVRTTSNDICEIFSVSMLQLSFSQISFFFIKF